MTSQVDSATAVHPDTMPATPELVDVSLVMHTSAASGPSCDAAQQFLDALRATGRTAEIVIVRNGIATNRPEIDTLDEPGIRVLRRDTRNHLQPTTQLRTGLAAARGRVVGVIHPGSGIDPDAIDTLVDLCDQGWDIALGVRTLGTRTDPSAPREGRRAEVLQRLIHLGVDAAYDGNRPSAVVMTRAAAEAVIPHLRADDDTFDVELLALARRLRFRRHAYQPVPHHGERGQVATDYITPWSAASILGLSVRLRRTSDLDRVGSLRDLRPRTAQIEERRVNHLVGMALRLTASGVDLDEAAAELIAAADRRRVLLEIACDMCAHDDRRSAGIRWSEAEPLLRRASVALRASEVRQV